MSRLGVLFGLNYKHCSKGHLQGCINDVKNVKRLLESVFLFKCKTFTDDNDLKSTSGMGILRNLYDTSSVSKKDNLEYVWIHYSGHGSFVKDFSFDEADGVDECLVPSDYEQHGMIIDDHIASILCHFNHKTKVICIFDCCHSGTIADIRYSWEGMKPTVENFTSSIGAKIITISSCLDEQVSVDSFSFIDRKFSGALTSSIIEVLSKKHTNNIFDFMIALKKDMSSKGYKQVPKLCSSYDLTREPQFLPNADLDKLRN